MPMTGGGANGTISGMVVKGPVNGGMSMMGGGMVVQANMGTSGMGGAMTTFMNSSMNKSGLTVADMQALMDHLNSTS